MGKLTNLTVKGQITIPKDVRDALGLKPNEPVEIEWDGGNQAIIRKAPIDSGLRERRREDMRRRLDLVARKYAHLATGRDPDEYMAELREPLPIPNPEDL